MAYLQSHNINIGMSRDITAAHAKEGYAYENYNIRVTAREHDSLLSVTNEKGNLEVLIAAIPVAVDQVSGGWTFDSSVTDGSLVISGTVIGYCVLDKYLVLFSTDRTEGDVHEEHERDHIYRIAYFPGTEKEFRGLELYSGDLGFSTINPIETLACYESEDVQKVYWTDGANQPRLINIADRYLKEYGISDRTKFDFVAEFEPTLKVSVEKVYEGSSLFSGGTVQYAFTYSNKYGQQSNIVYVTPVYYNSLNDRGVSEEENAACQWRITLSGFDTSWMYVNIYRLCQTEQNGQYTADRIARISTGGEGETAVYTDNGSSTESADPMSILYAGGREISAYTLEQKDNVLFLGNLKMLTVESDPDIKAELDSHRDTNGYSVYDGTESGGLLEFIMCDEEHSIPYVDATGYYPYECQLNFSSEQIRTFKKGEKYRFGLRLITSTGSRSAVYWIGDINQDKYWPVLVQDGTNARISKAAIRFHITEKLGTLLSEKGYAQAELMMAERTFTDSVVAAQGFLCPTLYNISDRCSGNAFSISSWYARPRLSKRLPNRHYEPLHQNTMLNCEIQCLTEEPNAYLSSVDADNNWVYQSWALGSVYSSGPVSSKYWWPRLYIYYGYVQDGVTVWVHASTVISENEPYGSRQKASEWAAGKIRSLGFNAVQSNDIYLQWKNKSDNGMNNSDMYKTDSGKRALWIYKNDDETLSQNKKAFSSYGNDLGMVYADRHHKSYFIDENVLTFHTPELTDENFASFDNAQYSLRIVGRAKITSNITDFVLDVTDQYGSQSQVMQFNLSTDNISDDPDGLVAFPLWLSAAELMDLNSAYMPGKDDDGKWESKLVESTMMYVYPWHKTGSITSMRSDPEDEMSNLCDTLSSKTEANLRFSYETAYDISWGEDGNIYPVRVHSSNEDTLLQIDTLFGKKTYAGNYDSLVTSRMKSSLADLDESETIKDNQITVNVYDEGYRLFSTDTLNGYSDIDSIYSTSLGYELTGDDDEAQIPETGPYKNYVHNEETDNLFYDPVNITVKSTPHIVLSLKGDDTSSYKISVLPNIYNSDDEMIDVIESPENEAVDLALPWEWHLNYNEDDFPYGILDLIVPSDIAESDKNYYEGDEMQLDSSQTYYTVYIYDNPAYLENLSWVPCSTIWDDDTGGYIRSDPSQAVLYRYSLDNKLYCIANVAYGFMGTKATEPWNVNVLSVTAMRASYPRERSFKIVCSVSLPLGFSQVFMDNGAYYESDTGNNVTNVYDVDLTNGTVTIYMNYMHNGGVVGMGSRGTFKACQNSNRVDYFTLTVNTSDNRELFEGTDYTLVYHTHGEYVTDKCGCAWVMGPSVDKAVLMSDFGSNENRWIYEDGEQENVTLKGFEYDFGEKVIVDNAKEPFLFVAELYKNIDPENDSRYGGISEYALQGNLFLPLGSIAVLDGGAQMIDAYAGDTYFQRWDCQKTYKYGDDRENGINEIVSLMLETRRNIDGRYDLYRGFIKNAALTPENSGLVNNAYSNLGTLFSSSVLDEKYSLSDYPAQITWTLQKNLSEETDTWTNVTLGATLDMDGEKGPVESLNRYNNMLVAIQDRGIAEVLYNTRTQLTTEQGVPIEIANSGSVEGKRYISEEYGCSNKWAICQSAGGIWMIDNQKKAILRLGEKIENISETKGFSQWMRSHNHIEKWDPANFGNYRAYNDIAHNDIYFIGPESDEGNTLCFNEMLDEFVSFYDYGNVTALTSMSDRLLSLRKRSEDESETKLWLQGEGLYDHLYGEYQNYHVTWRIAPDPYTDKTFTNLEYRADMFDMNEPNPYMEGEGRLTGNTFDRLKVWDEYQGNEIPLVFDSIKDLYPDSRRKWRVWRTELPRARKGPDNPFGLNRIRNPWIWLELEKDTSSYEDGHNEMMRFNDLVVKYIM